MASSCSSWAQAVIGAGAFSTDAGLLRAGNAAGATAQTAQGRTVVWFGRSGVQ